MESNLDKLTRAFRLAIDNATRNKQGYRVFRATDKLKVCKLIERVQCIANASMKTIAKHVYNSSNLNDQYANYHSVFAIFKGWMASYHRGRIDKAIKKEASLGANNTDDNEKKTIKKESIDLSDLACWLKVNHKDVLREYIKVKAQQRINQIIDEMVSSI